MLHMCGHISTCISTYFDSTTCIIKICYLFEQITLRTCNNIAKTIVFTLQE